MTEEPAEVTEEWPERRMERTKRRKESRTTEERAEVTEESAERRMKPLKRRKEYFPH
ncbi:hypothetical protein ACIQ7N_13045 [Lysinibacillus sp. NPDC095746]|uniref:hypothetical protein n=1 Tax=Lysinibacillus sp. NPDC095746 TaxID=3364134 RepID=UPI0037F3E527